LDGGIRVLVNDAKTRWFLCLCVKDNAQLTRLVTHVDKAMATFHQPPYYQPPIFHISIAWSLTDISPDIVALANEQWTPRTFTATQAMCKFGHMNFALLFQ
jgi:hypothetical protein